MMIFGLALLVRCRRRKDVFHVRARLITLFALLLCMPLFLVPAARAQYSHHGNFYNGARQGGRGGYYGGGNSSGYNHGNYSGYNRDQYQGHGIGAGRGALIGGAGGAALGAIFGGGLKGALIGGGAGAGIGAIAGHEHQQTMKRHYYERRNGYYPR